MAEARYRRGDRVRFRWGHGRVEGVVKEDRGPIGVNGRRLYGVNFRMGAEAEEVSYIELPAAELEPAGDPVSAE